MEKGKIIKHLQGIKNGPFSWTLCGKEVKAKTATTVQRADCNCRMCLLSDRNKK